jgi:hypothetical protein
LVHCLTVENQPAANRSNGCVDAERLAFLPSFVRLGLDAFIGASENASVDVSCAGQPKVDAVFGLLIVGVHGVGVGWPTGLNRWPGEVNPY